MLQTEFLCELETVKNRSQNRPDLFTLLVFSTNFLHHALVKIRHWKVNMTFMNRTRTHNTPVKSLRWKRWNCERKIRQNCQLKSEKRLKTWIQAVLFIYVIHWKILIKNNETFLNLVYGEQFCTQMEQIHKKITWIVIALLRLMVTFCCKLQWIFIAKIFFIAMNSSIDETLFSIIPLKF